MTSLESDYLFIIVTKYGKRYEYRYQRALEIFDDEGIRLYAYEKAKIKATKILIAWKPEKASFSY